jgi:glucosamine-6-phosphate deaminase
MRLEVFDNSREMAEAAAKHAIKTLKSAIDSNGQAAFIAATGESQFEFLDNLTADSTVDWSKTIMFHLDEYVGISESHPASFRKYLQTRVLAKVSPGQVNLIEGDAVDPVKEAERVGELLVRRPVDVAFVGVGENGHLAFNDPPADFKIEAPFIVAGLDEVCRRQQVNEGWFSSLEEVPPQAITMTVRQIMKSKTIITVVPGLRKAQAVLDCFGNQEVSPAFPASILKQHPDSFVYLDQESASLLS